MSRILPSIDEGTDTYDTIDWLIKNVRNNNGRVGMLGVSYDGWTTIMAAIEPHPALKAISPQASPADMWLGDDFHHNGAFRLSYGFEYAAMMESGKDVQQFSFDRYDTVRLVLSPRPAQEREREVPARQDPDVERLRRASRLRRLLEAADDDSALTSVKVPTLNVAGWWDQEDFYGPCPHLRRAREARHSRHQLSRRRPVASRRLERRHR
jgi:putative CocE/NonD family hydrolase